MHRGPTIRPKAGQRFVGQGPGSILSGARVITEFARVGDFWTAAHRAIRKRHGSCEKGKAACGFADAAFIDDVPLRRVLDRSQLGPGRFMIDMQRGELLIADNPAGHKVEVTRAVFAFISLASDVLIENLVVEKFANPAQQGAIQGENAKGWIVRRVEARLNSGAGGSVGSRGRIENSVLHHNGQLGATAGGRDIRLEGNRIAYNNTRGFDPGWEAGGVKITVSEEVALLRNHVHDNAGPGLWCDVDCRNVLYEGNVVENNSGPGIFHEISFSAVIRNNVLRTNGRSNRQWFWESEIQIAASAGVEVYDNMLTVRREGGGILLIDQRREKDGGGLYRTQNNSVHHNDITFLGAGDMGGVSDARTPEGDDMIISNGENNFDFNTYRLTLPGSTIEFVWGHASLDWEGFRGMGQEKNGVLLSSHDRRIRNH